MRVQRFPAGRVRVFDVHVDGAIERGKPRFVRFRVKTDQRRQVFRPCQGCRIDHKRPQAPLLVDEIQVRVVVRDDPPDVQGDDRAQRGDVALGDDGVGHFEQRSPALVLHVKRSLACDGRLLMAQVVDREGQVVTNQLEEREIPGRRRFVRIGV